MTEHEWDVKCKAAFIGLYAVRNLCADIKMNPYDMMDMLNRMLSSTSPKPTTEATPSGTPPTAGRE